MIHAISYLYIIHKKVVEMRKEIRASTAKIMKGDKEDAVNASGISNLYLSFASQFRNCFLNTDT